MKIVLDTNDIITTKTSYKITRTENRLYVEIMADKQCLINVFILLFLYMDYWFTNLCVWSLSVRNGWFNVYAYTEMNILVFLSNK